MKIAPITLIVSMFFYGCIFWKCGSEETITTKAYIYKTQPHHWGRGYYKQEIFYKYEYKGDTLKSDFLYPKLGRVYSINFSNVGDTLVIEFPVNKPAESKVKKLIKVKDK